MSNNDSLGDRMKAYEDSYRFYVPNRFPLIIRVDGKAFHTLTRHLDKPVDYRFHAAMVRASFALCREIQGAECAFMQSDEISILAYPWKSIESQAWFGNNLQKMASVASSIAAVNFSRSLANDLELEVNGYFDGRCFILPEPEIENYFLWRQQDTTRNAIQATAQANFSHKEIQNKSCKDLEQMLLDIGVIISPSYKYGNLIVKQDDQWTSITSDDFKDEVFRQMFRGMVKNDY